jgi:hypothetical protein
VVSGNSVIGTRIQRCLVASPGPPMSPHHDGWVGALTVCDVASKRPHLIQSLLRESVAARSGNDKHSCNAGGPRRCWTEPAKTHQQRSRCVGQQAWKRNGLTLITPARGSSQAGRGLLSVLLVAHLFHPIDGLAIQRLLNGDMCHCRRGRCPVPMLLAGRKPDDVIRSDFLNSPAPTLCPPAAGRDD